MTGSLAHPLTDSPVQVVKSYEDTESVNHEGVLEIGRLRSQTVQQLVTEVIGKMEINNNNTKNAV